MKPKTKDLSRLNNIETLSIGLLGLACSSFLIGFFVWFVQQKTYAPLLAQMGLEFSSVQTFFINGSPFALLIPVVLIAGFLVWKEWHWKTTSLSLGLNVAFLVSSLLMFWAVDSSLRGGMNTMLEFLSK
jgi:ABC-type antimicrobial peptide transport system permease subunit